MSDFDDMEKSLLEITNEKDSKSESEILNDQISELKRQNLNLKRTLWEYGIEDESEISDEEYICLVQIERLKDMAMIADLSEQEVRIFDLLNKNLRMIRGGVEKKAVKGKLMSKGDLLKIVDGGKKDDK